MNAEWPSFCPPYDFDAAGSFTSLFMGAPIQTVPDLVERANPITYVTPDDPPMLIAHGLADCTVPFAQSQILYDALHAAGVRATLNLAPGAGHGDLTFYLSQASITIDFLDQQLHAL
jgi:dipeptidyl aminopeptidase/acylaminoacyl peptidase